MTTGTYSSIEIVTANPSLLEGRTSRCSCGEERPSSTDLAFFQFWGEGSRRAREQCGICRYNSGGSLHDTEATEPLPPHLRHVERHEFEPIGALPHDSHYCGCGGWD